jgi:hypothetical protein
MYRWVPPVRERLNLPPISPIQPYARIIPYMEQKHYERRGRYPSSPVSMTNTKHEPVAVKPEFTRPFHSYVVYNKNKQKTWCFPHQGWLFQVYG